VSLRRSFRSPSAWGFLSLQSSQFFASSFAGTEEMSRTKTTCLARAFTKLLAGPAPSQAAGNRQLLRARVCEAGRMKRRDDECLF